MTFMLKETGTSVAMHPALEQAPPTFGETFRAGDTADRIETDRWQTTQRAQRSLLADMQSAIGDDWGDGPDLGRTRSTNLRFDRTLDYALERVTSLRASSAVGRFDDLPTTREEFQQSITKSLRDEYDDAAMTLELGSGFPGFLGRMYGAAKDENTVLSLPFGASGGARVGVAVLAEAIAGGGTELLTLDRQHRQAERLGLPEPNALLQVGTAALLSGALGGVLSGAQRFAAYRRAMRPAGQRPATSSQLGHLQSYEQARTELELGQPITGERDSRASEPGTLGDILRMSDFDFSPTGNASPRTNRIGYVFGKFLELGYEPHIAAGLVANFMAESGIGLDTRAVGDGGNAFGLAQWNGPRRHQYLEFAARAGKDPADIDTQIAFAHHELTGSEAEAMSKIAAARNAREAAALTSQYYERPGQPHLPKRVAYAATLMEQYEGGRVPRWEGAVSPTAVGAEGFTGYGTSRGYTGTGQVAVGDDMRVDVEYEVVDASLLQRASGDLQPRDRSRATSDAWVNDTAARLDPALLMPAPTADRGTPLVGPDNVVESGNGRFAAIERAYEKFPDRADAYRQQIEATTGKPVPEGMERPVLIARRQSALDDDARRRLVVDAQDSGVARMTATERARVGRAALTADTLALLKPGKLAGEANRDFARRFADFFPRSERNAFIGADKAISADGIRQIQDSLFARAWEAPDIVARAIEAEPGEMKALFDALSAAAPEVAKLKADIDAGLVRADMDITPYVLDAVRMVIAARDAAKTSKEAAQIVEDLLAEVDLLDGPVAPLTQALVRVMMPNGKLASSKSISDFLARYAAEARKVGQTGDAFADDLGPIDVLKRMDPEHFGHLESAARTQPAQPERARPDPEKPDFVNTRGQGTRFHGSRNAEWDGSLYEGAYASQNFYGQGFYTTDAVAIAQGYNRGGGLFVVREKSPVKAFDMEQPVPDWLRAVKDGEPENSDFRGLLEDVLEEKPANVRELYDLLREFGTSEFRSADEIQDYFETLEYAFREQGYGAIDHDGGLRTGKTSHQVRIYFDPDKVLSVERVDPDSFTVKQSVSDVSPAPLPRPFGEVYSAPEAPAVIEIADDAFTQGAVSPEAEAADDAFLEELREALSSREAAPDLPELELRMADGSTFTTRELVEDLDADETLDTVIDLCVRQGGTNG